MTPSFDRCPHCGQDLEVKSRERLSAANHLSLTVEDGRLLGAEFGITEPDWEDCVTIEYACDRCGEPLPEAHQQALDAVLDNRRRE